MLEELRRCNSIGNEKGVEFFLNYIYQNEIKSLDELQKLITLDGSCRLNCNATISFFKAIGFLENDSIELQLTEYALGLGAISIKGIIKIASIRIIDFLLNEGVFDSNTLEIDYENGRVLVNRNSIPLKYAAFRNYLIDFGILKIQCKDKLFLEGGFEQVLINKVAKRKKKMTLAHLLEIKQKQYEQGVLAEEYVLEYEKKRLQNHEKYNLIRRISDFDVKAGYDIISYIDVNDQQINKFIEVKSYSRDIHFFWSENEVDVAKLKGKSYFLCLVDIDKINKKNYEPLFIQDPYNVIFQDNSWVVDTSTYRINRIKVEEY